MESRGEFWRGSFGGCFGPFHWTNKEQNVHPEMPGKIQIRIWEFRDQKPHSKDLSLSRSVAIMDFGVSYRYPLPKKHTQKHWQCLVDLAVQICAQSTPLDKKTPDRAIQLATEIRDREFDHAIRCTELQHVCSELSYALQASHPVAFYAPHALRSKRIYNVVGIAIQAAPEGHRIYRLANCVAISGAARSRNVEFGW